MQKGLAQWNNEVHESSHEAQQPGGSEEGETLTCEFFSSSSGSQRWGTSAGRFRSSWLAVRLTSERIKSAQGSSRPSIRTPLHTRRYDRMYEYLNKGQCKRKRANQKLKPQPVWTTSKCSHPSWFLFDHRAKRPGSRWTQTSISSVLLNIRRTWRTFSKKPPKRLWPSCANKETIRGRRNASFCESCKGLCSNWEETEWSKQQWCVQY